MFTVSSPIFYLWVKCSVLKWCLTNTGVQFDRNGNLLPVKNQSPRQRIDGTAALLNCYVGLYEHYNEFTGAI
jgi:phage terminase large subunit-like protein